VRVLGTQPARLRSPLTAALEVLVGEEHALAVVAAGSLELGVAAAAGAEGVVILCWPTFEAALNDLADEAEIYG